MSYSKSNARVVYDTFSNQLLSLAKSTNRIRGTVLTYNHKNLIYQSLVVLLCSSIEEYHKTFIEDWFYKLRMSNVSMKTIPNNTRMLGFLHNTENHYKNFLYDRDSEKDIINKLVKNKQILKAYFDDSETFNINSLAKNVWSNKKYPSSKNIITLYNRLGISNIFGKLSSLRHKNYKVQLDSFLSVRESIAHAGAGAVTFDDVKDHIEFVNELIYMLDKELYKHCCKVSGASYWPK